MMGRTSLQIGACLFVLASVATAAWAGEWPALPDKDGSADIPAQSAEGTTEPRQVRVYVAYPQGELKNVGPGTGLMLTLHNWGGTAAAGTADPRVLAQRYNVVAISLDYLHSGPWNEAAPDKAYDFGYVQALDALRALWWVETGLSQRQVKFHRGRTYAAGGSGGGNVTLMVNKLAPRTLACAIDMCGMAELSDDVAFGLPGGSSLNAGYQQDPASPRYLSPDMQAIRFAGHPEHLQTMHQLGATAKIVVVHGADDNVCPAADKRAFVANAQDAKLDIEPHFITQADLDGKVLTGTGHSLGNRTEIVERFAGPYLRPDSDKALARDGANDFERREPIEYQTPRGKYVISYEQGFPVGRFEDKDEG
ncbi:MAG: alpha/beta hydrolase family protein [Pirellulales bacterium]